MEANQYELVIVYQEILNEDKVLYLSEVRLYTLETIAVDNQMINESVTKKNNEVLFIESNRRILYQKINVSPSSSYVKHI